MASEQQQHHEAALLPSPGSRLTLSPLPTPTPALHEVLIRATATALNPVDAAQRDKAFPPVQAYPAVLGCDVAGTILRAGADVPLALQQPGARVAAFASGFYHAGNPAYGSFQSLVLARAEGVIRVPAGVSDEEAAALPLATLTALTGWGAAGLDVTRPAEGQAQALLVWGAASSVGALALQSARRHGRVYAVASARNHAYLAQLGAAACFDYADPDVVDKIVARAEEDGLGISRAYAAVPGSLQGCLDVLRRTRGSEMGRVAHAPPLLPGHPEQEGVEVRFVAPPADEGERNAHIARCFAWLAAGLESGVVVPSPAVRVVGHGLAALDAGVDELARGVSATKLVVTL